MGGWRVYVFHTLLCATGFFYSYGLQTEEFKTRYLTHFTSTKGSNERQLLSDLHGVLERLKNDRFPSLWKKHSYLPACDPGDQCALRKGSRIGKLCDCSLPRTCNSFLHRCL
ncbi:cocaine- and amphetamine-regulated transcript protein-like [Diretmus argenteus]